MIVSLPALVTIPAGVFNGKSIDAFRLGQTPVTNAQYAAHADRHGANPFVLLETSKTGATSIIARGKDPIAPLVEEFRVRRKPKILYRKIRERWPKKWDTRVPLVFGALTVFELRKDLSSEGFDRPNQPVVNATWFHAFEYCVSNGFFLPSDDQWEYAARGPEGHEYGTRSGRLTREEAHYDTKSSADVGSYPPNGFGLYDMTGNVSEWTARNASHKYPYGMRGGTWDDDDPNELRAACRFDNEQGPAYYFAIDLEGFRVAAAAQ